MDYPISDIVRGKTKDGEAIVPQIPDHAGSPIGAWAISRRCVISQAQEEGTELANHPDGIPDLHNSDGSCGCTRRAGAWFITEEAILNAQLWAAKHKEEASPLFGTYPYPGKKKQQKYKKGGKRASV